MGREAHGMFAGGAFSSRTAVPQKSGNPPLSGVHSLWIAFSSLRPFGSVNWRWFFAPSGAMLGFDGPDVRWSMVGLSLMCWRTWDFRSLGHASLLKTQRL